MLTLTDHVGNSASDTSGSVLVDLIAPTGSITYPQAGRPIEGTLTVSGSASDLNFSGYVLAYGAGSAPTSWSTITTSSSPVSSGTLATWATGVLTGVYTLRLTVTDAAGNTTIVTNTVYLDNTDRGSEPYYTSVPFDLGGGWNLGLNVATGEASLARGLFSIPSFGPPQSLSLTYNSADSGVAGQFGTGWSSNLTQYLTFESGFVVWHRADGGRVPFGQVGGVWTALAGHYETLAPISGGGYRITETDQSSYSFDSSGRLSAISDRYGVSLTLVWGNSSATATDASGRATSIVIDSTNHRITGVTDSAGRAWGFAYTGANLTALTDPAGKVTTLTYNGSNQLTAISRQRTPAGGSAQTIAWAFGYTAGELTSVTDPIAGVTNPVTHDTFGYVAGTTTVNILKDISTPASPLYNTSTYVFDSHGWVTSATDPDGWVTNSVFDANGNVTSSSRQVSATTWATTSSTYDGAGNITSVTDPVGSVTSSTYRTVNGPTITSDLLSEIDAAGTSIASTTDYVYDSAGHLCRKVQNPTVALASIGCTGSLGGAADQDLATGYTYTTNNQLLTGTDPLGTLTLYGYDSNGNQIGVTANYVAGTANDHQHHDHRHVRYHDDRGQGRAAGQRDRPDHDRLARPKQDDQLHLRRLWQRADPDRARRRLDPEPADDQHLRRVRQRGLHERERVVLCHVVLDERRDHHDRLRRRRSGHERDDPDGHGDDHHEHRL